MGDATLISGSGVWPSSLALADCSCASFLLWPAACHRQTACICSSTSCISSVEWSSPAPLAIVCTIAMLCPRRPAACMQRLRVSASRRAPHRLISDDHHLALRWYQRYEREALGRARKWADSRISSRASATVSNAPDVLTVCNSPAAMPSCDRRRI